MNKHLSFTSAQLKLFAYAFMLIDHIGYTMAMQNSLKDFYFPHMETVYIFMRSIGRIAFPIFCFLLLEGLEHTRSKAKYMFRMFIFALISEPCFDLMTSGAFYTPTYQNVLFTLLISGLYFCIYEGISQKLSSKIIRTVLNILLLIVAIFITYFLHTDYSVSGVILILGISIIRKRQPKDFSLSFLLMFCTVFFAFTVSNIISAPDAILAPSMWLDTYILPSLGIQLFEIFSLFFILPYSGSAGRPLPKAVYYLFYPVHLLLLGLLNII